MGRISTSSLKSNDDLDDLLEEPEDEEMPEEEEDEIVEEDEMEEEIPVPKSKKRRLKHQKKDNHIYVTLNWATTYLLDGKLYRQGITEKEPRSKLEKFKANGWFTVRY